MGLLYIVERRLWELLRVRSASGYDFSYTSYLTPTKDGVTK